MSKGKHKKTKEDFIEAAENKHNNFYDYSKVSFTPRPPGLSWTGTRTRILTEYNGEEKVTIICPKHGEFVQRCRKHLEGHGCTHCGIEDGHGHRIDKLKVAHYGHKNVRTLLPTHIELQTTPSDGVLRTILLDHDDEEILDIANWYVTGHQESRKSRTNYCVARRNLRTATESFDWLGTCLKMHRLIMSRALGRVLRSEEEVDHINHNGLDNRRENLRIATASENRFNTKKTSRLTSSQYIGVCYNKSKKKWMSYYGTSLNKGKTPRTYLGLYNTEEGAARARDKAVKEISETAVLNFPEEA